MKNYYLSILLGTLLLWGCKKEDEVHPEVITLEATPTSANSCLFKARVVTQGTTPMVDYGFIYGTSYELNIQSGTKVSLGNKVAAGVVEKEVSGLANVNNQWGNSYSVRAYITNEKGTVYGGIISFTLPSVMVHSVSPTSGKSGDRVTITGKHFSTNPESRLEVKFANATAKIVEATAEKLVVEIPTGLNTNSYYNREIPLYVIINGRSIVAHSNFQVFPNVKDFSPKTGTFGSTVVITGDNIPASSYSSYGVSVSFGGVTAPIVAITNTGITVTVPTGIKTAQSKVSFTALGQTTELPGEFTIEPPAIAAFSPASGLPGTSVTITGSNFNTSSYNGNIVRFGNVQATVTNTTVNSITVTVPSSMPAGTYKVSVFTGVHTVTAADSYTVASPAITGFSPASGTVGTEVTIEGLFGTSSWDSSVKFGTTNAYIQSYSSSSMKVIVPSGLAPGKMKIVVTTAGQTVTSTNDFTVLAPTVTGFSPASGNAGTLVTISGTGFSPYTYNNVVKFGTIATNVVSATATSITATVPSNIGPGTMKISVTANGQTATSNQDFTVVQ